MRFLETNLGFSTADGERVVLRYENGDLHLAFEDWREQHVEHVFVEALAFRWQEFDETEIRDDQTYLVEGSDWLARQCELAGVKSAEFVHHKLCFNAVGVLDVVARVAPRGSVASPTE